MGLKIADKAALEAHMEAGDSLRGADFAGAQLQEVDLSGQDLSEARFRYAILTGATLTGAILAGANLRHCKLVQADLRYADLSGADLSHADLHAAIVGENCWQGAVLRNATGVSRIVFFPNVDLKALLARRGVSLGEQDLTIAGDAQSPYELEVAYRLVEIEGAPEQRDARLGKVLTRKELEEAGAEIDGKVVLIGQTAYRCEPGVIGIPSELQTKEDGAAPPVVEEEKQTDVALLEEFLIKGLE